MTGVAGGAKDEGKELTLWLPTELVHELKLLADVKGVDLVSEAQNAIVEYLKREAGVKPSVVDLFSMPPYLRKTIMALMKLGGGGTLQELTRVTGRPDEVEVEALKRLEAQRHIQQDRQAPEVRYVLTISRGAVGLLDQLAHKYGVGP